MFEGNGRRLGGVEGNKMLKVLVKLQRSYSPRYAEQQNELCEKMRTGTSYKQEKKTMNVRLCPSFFFSQRYYVNESKLCRRLNDEVRCGPT